MYNIVQGHNSLHRVKNPGQLGFHDIDAWRDPTLSKLLTRRPGSIAATKDEGGELEVLNWSADAPF